MKRIKTDIVLLEEEMRDEHKFSRQSPLKKVIKRVLTELNHWKNLPRGNPKKALEVRKQNEQRKIREAGKTST
jgi:hypothetical protein